MKQVAIDFDLKQQFLGKEFHSKNKQNRLYTIMATEIYKDYIYMRVYVCSLYIYISK